MWDMLARGAMFGITRGVNRNHIVRAALESICLSDKRYIGRDASGYGYPAKRTER